MWVYPPFWLAASVHASRPRKQKTPAVGKFHSDELVRYSHLASKHPCRPGAVRCFHGAPTGITTDTGTSAQPQFQEFQAVMLH